MSTLRKGEAQYNERQQELRILKLKVADLKREMQIASTGVGQMDDLKREVYHCQRELLQEKTKVKALSEELENPMNVHRWRKLEGSDPATYEMIQKIQTRIANSVILVTVLFPRNVNPVLLVQKMKLTTIGRVLIRRALT